MFFPFAGILLTLRIYFWSFVACTRKCILRTYVSPFFWHPRFSRFLHRSSRSLIEDQIGSNVKNCWMARFEFKKIFEFVSLSSLPPLPSSLVLSGPLPHVGCLVHVRPDLVPPPPPVSHGCGSSGVGGTALQHLFPLLPLLVLDVEVDLGRQAEQEDHNAGEGEPERLLLGPLEKELLFASNRLRAVSFKLILTGTSWISLLRPTHFLSGAWAYLFPISSTGKQRTQKMYLHIFCRVNNCIWCLTYTASSWSAPPRSPWRRSWDWTLERRRLNFWTCPRPPCSPPLRQSYVRAIPPCRTLPRPRRSTPAHPLRGGRLGRQYCIVCTRMLFWYGIMRWSFKA